MGLTIYRTDTASLMNQNLLHQLLERLPKSLQPRALRYQSQLSAYNYAVGRLLLKQGLESFGQDNDLEKIEFLENGKPCLDGFYFNISHSSSQVICAFSSEGRLGVDIEKITPIDFTDFTSMFSVKEWVAIKAAKDPMRAFYWFWTRKESIIKALGLNLSYLHQIELDVTCDHIVVDGSRWFLSEVDVGEGYVGALCCAEEIDEVEMIEISLPL